MFVPEILKTKGNKFMRDKLAYDNNTAYNWTYAKNKRRNNKVPISKDSTNDPNDSDTSAFSSISSSQVHDHTRTGETLGSHKRKQDMENTRISAPKRNPTTSQAQSNSGLAQVKSSISQTHMGPSDQSGKVPSPSTSQMLVTPAQN